MFLACGVDVVDVSPWLRDVAMEALGGICYSLIISIIWSNWGDVYIHEIKENTLDVLFSALSKYIT